MVFGRYQEKRWRQGIEERTAKRSNTGQPKVVGPPLCTLLSCSCSRRRCFFLCLYLPITVLPPYQTRPEPEAYSFEPAPIPDDAEKTSLRIRAHLDRRQMYHSPLALQFQLLFSFSHFALGGAHHTLHAEPHHLMAGTRSCVERAATPLVYDYGLQHTLGSPTKSSLLSTTELWSTILTFEALRRLGLLPCECFPVPSCARLLCDFKVSFLPSG